MAASKAAGVRAVHERRARTRVLEEVGEQVRLAAPGFTMTTTAPRRRIPKSAATNGTPSGSAMMTRSSGRTSA